MWDVNSDFRNVNLELRCKPRIERCKLRIQRCKLRIVKYVLRIVRCKLGIVRWEFRIKRCKQNCVIKLRIWLSSNSEFTYCNLTFFSELSLRLKVVFFRFVFSELRNINSELHEKVKFYNLLKFIKQKVTITFIIIFLILWWKQASIT